MAITSYTKDGKKFFLVEVKSRTKEGKQVYRSRQGITSERKALDIEFQLRKELEGIINQKPIQTWSKWLDIFLERMKLSFKPSTLYTYEKCLNRYVTPIWKNIDILSIGRADVHKLVFEQMPDEVTPHTRKSLLKLVRRAFQLAVDEQILSFNPCAGLAVKVPETEYCVLNGTEAEVLLKEAKASKHPFYPVWVFALGTGMRSGEMICLLWQDVDFESRLIHVNKSWNSKNGLKSTKSGKTRVVPISDSLLAFLQEYRLSCDPNQEYVLPRLTEWYRGDQAKVLRAFCKSIRITPIRFHDLRATFITNMLAQGVSLARVMAIVGHNQIDTTNGYLRKAGVDLKGSTDSLGYQIPSFGSSEGELISLSSYRDAQI